MDHYHYLVWNVMNTCNVVNTNTLDLCTLKLLRETRRGWEPIRLLHDTFASKNVACACAFTYFGTHSKGNSTFQQNSTTQKSRITRYPPYMLFLCLKEIFHQTLTFCFVKAEKWKQIFENWKSNTINLSNTLYM